MPKRCERAGCEAQSVFNVRGATKGRFCRAHKEVDMVDVKSKRCERAGCEARPAFNVPGATKGRFCRAHKEIDMVDVKHKRCERTGCETRPSYGLPGHAPTLCATHKAAGTMKDPKRTCAFFECRETATHGITRPERCEAHALLGDVNMVERECVTCFLPYILDARGMCVDCAEYTSGKRPRLAKQREVLQFLDYEFKNHPYDTTDVVPRDLRDCARRERPDVLWDRADRIVILEVDEDQHKDRPCECEQTRMMNVSQALGAERTVWIRYNPDAFASATSRSWSSKAKRHAVLKEWLTWALTAETLPYTISVVHLFFDGFTNPGNVGVEKFL